MNLVLWFILFLFYFFCLPACANVIFPDNLSRFNIFSHTKYKERPSNKYYYILLSAKHSNLPPNSLRHNSWDDSMLMTSPP